MSKSVSGYIYLIVNHGIIISTLGASLRVKMFAEGRTRSLSHWRVFNGIIIGTLGNSLRVKMFTEGRMRSLSHWRVFNGIMYNHRYTGKLSPGQDVC
ncbi:hypothetical protein J6590_002388 [Homalodisca vitripennis]|nr:hypothetical protein J6590_002388 [Homalodisca vitripennis]